MLEQLKYFEIREGVDIGYNNSNIQHPKYLNSDKGFDKNLKLEEMLILAKELNANIIIKAGKNAKWYIKKCNKEFIEKEIEKQKWRDTSRYKMYIVEFI